MEKMKHAMPRVNRWLMELQQYQLDIKYRKGSDNSVAHALSRNLPEDPNRAGGGGTPATSAPGGHSSKGGGGVGPDQRTGYRKTTCPPEG